MVAIYMFMMGWCGNRPELRRGAAMLRPRLILKGTS